ncbi:MAG: BlaI/MecI/CopY family transcriptional regulator [Sciscionella sp.]
MAVGPDGGAQRESGASRRAPGELESEVLATLWASDKALSPAQVQRELGGDLAHTTVVTILTRLLAKGVLERTRRGRSFYYSPVADRPGLAARRMRQVLDAESNRDSVLAQFVSDLDDQDGRLLRELLARSDQQTESD